MVISELYSRARKMLADGDIADSVFDATCIMEDALGMTKAELVMRGSDIVTEETAERVIGQCEKRLTGYPLQYILGEWEFYGCRIKVGEGVLIPRADTETLVDCVLEHMKRNDLTAPRIADLCSGSGCIAIALKKYIPDADITAVELSVKATEYLVENARSNGTELRYIRGDVMNGGLFSYFMKDNEPQLLDCIVSNPPYLTASEMEELQREVAFEPSEALDGGNDGLKFYRVIACLWRELLKDGGLMAFEIGEQQAADVTVIMEKSGFCDIRVIKDLGGNDRVVCGVLSAGTGEQRS